MSSESYCSLISSDLPETKTVSGAIFVLLLNFFNIIRNAEYSHIFNNDSSLHSEKNP